jgi:hypothetical protein
MVQLEEGRCRKVISLTFEMLIDLQAESELVITVAFAELTLPWCQGSVKTSQVGSIQNQPL